jgi:peptidoglycan/LPS O-acetylase OafA/YrhL
VEGLRAVAVGLVLLYHAGFFLFPGGFVGVDVFFVISGFLITGMLVREVERSGRVSLGHFYARRARRLLPAASVALVFTALMTWASASVVQWRAVGGDIVAAAAYVVNWRLAARSVDYLAEGMAASPVQHYWSLSVEEQFYVIWPFLLVLVALLVRRLGWRVRPTMAAALAAIVVPSLLWSILATARTPQSAFFVTTTRLWELGVGAFVAVGAVLWRRLSFAAARALGWLGLAAIAGSALLLDAASTWPGALALLPVLGTAAVIIAGSGERGAAPFVLSWRWMVWIGGLSYSLYLWHWPLLIAQTNVFGAPGQKIGLLVVLASVIPAWISHKLVENPLRFSKRLTGSVGLTLSVGAGFMAVTVFAGLVLAASVPRAPTAPVDAASGARALRLVDGKVQDLELVDRVGSITPAPADATKDRPDAYDRGCQADQVTTTPTFCEYGDRQGEVTVVLTGDSKALQWVAPLDAISEKNHWRLRVATKSSCSFSGALIKYAQGRYQNCLDYSDNLVKALLAERPDIVLTSQTAKKAFGADGELAIGPMVDGLVKSWTTLESAGIDVIPILDNPRPFDFDGQGAQVYACVADHVDDLGRCAFATRKGIAESAAPVLRQAAERAGDLPVLDLTDALCNARVCPPVIQGVLVYRQGSHVTNTYALSMENVIAERLVPLVEAARGR